MQGKHKINLIIVGVGPHSKRVYVPILRKLSSKYNIDIKLGIDLKEKQADIEAYLKDLGIKLNMLYIDPFNPLKNVPRVLQSRLDRFVDENKVSGVIIATEPLSHVAYAKWALKKGLNILMDKPISTEENVTSDFGQAKKIYSDFKNLINNYRALQKRESTIFSVNVQRRYHPGHQKVVQLIKEVAERFNAPVTSIQSMHADGQWRMPSEIVTQIYHPYCQGYGKCSHSGYHFFDIVYNFYQAGVRKGKKADSAEVFTSFITPKGFIRQFSEKDYVKYFGRKYLSVKRWNDNRLDKLYGKFGEIDAFSVIRLLKNGEAICNISINLLHNSFARRTWMRPGKDLYKGNGRVKQEMHIINQGPFQTIQIHSYESNDKHNINTEKDFLLGGNNHFDIYVFRNSGMFSARQQPLTIYHLKDLIGHKDILREIERAKEHVVVEFLEFLEGRIKKSDLKSNIDSHEVPVEIMSSIYRSHIRYTKKQNPLVNFNL